MTRPLVKICGITREDDAIRAVEAGADFIGLVFAKSSPRSVDPNVARRIVKSTRATDKRVSVAGVFVDEAAAEINALAERVGLDFIQLHGSERADILSEIEWPVIRALRVADSLPDGTEWKRASWILYDTYAAGIDGGTGSTFDWSLLEGIDRSRRFFLAGGLNPGNVAHAVEIVRPTAIDVSSGVEDAPGIKSATKIRALFAAVGENER